MKERREKGNFSLFMISIEIPIWTAIFPGSHMLQAKVFPLFTFQMLLLSFQSPIIFSSQLLSPGLLPIHIRIAEDCHAIAHVAPRRECREPARGSRASSPQHFLVTQPMKAIPLCGHPLWPWWPYDWAASSRSVIRNQGNCEYAPNGRFPLKI